MHWFINSLYYTLCNTPPWGWSQQWSKHVGGILCLSYEILLYVYMHLLFSLPYLIVIMFKSWCLRLDMHLWLCSWLNQEGGWYFPYLPLCLKVFSHSFSQSVFWAQYTSAFHLPVFNSVSIWVLCNLYCCFASILTDYFYLISELPVIL